MATSIKIDEEMKSRVRQLADNRRRSPHWIMREAIAQYVKREEQRDVFKQEALDAWSSYKETGLHITGSETSDWLRAWGSDDNEIPKCHE
ncbi:CopG family ribbon-helix-helix protein [Salinisphaera aquimarina]|uniref:CopG family ribbon-helix-helix protein n=1 Tax=Salinisphaera aquimarina TaxID=2094031 RepID=A0ABV7EVQ1_9GAMM